jgi:predicted methyltransferase
MADNARPRRFNPISRTTIMKTRRHASWILGAIALAASVSGSAQAQDEQTARLRAALASSERSAENKARDAARKPVEVIEFLGIEDGMTALDVFAVGGWFTEVLSAAVGPSGKVYSQNPAFFTSREGFIDAESARNERLGNVAPIHGEIAAANINGQVDVAITNNNLHDLYNRGGEEAAMPLIKGVYDALKPGGVFGVIDHVGIVGQDNAQLHRMNLDAARAMLVEAGFAIVEESDLLRNPADDHTRGPNDASLGGNSDRFLIKAQKPN